MLHSLQGGQQSRDIVQKVENKLFGCGWSQLTNEYMRFNLFYEVLIIDFVVKKTIQLVILHL